ncbi:MAG: hypothetical protein SVO01_13555 [Thermotogota bacterium]|nr:hypothetical protein [Thermotogota bacterium]
MSDEIINAKSGKYGRVNIVVPWVAKETMLSWFEKSGMKKSEFFKTALLMGTVQLSKQLGIKEGSSNHFSDHAQQHARR